jgi:glycopeptide antibiotics resistance protein
VRLGEILTIPWLLPGAAISIVVGFAASGRVGRALGVRQAVAWVMVLSLGVIVAATLTPQWEALEFGARGSSSCDMSRLGLAPLEEFLQPTESNGNVLLFIPLGATIGLLPRSRRKAAVVIAAITLPFAIETIQLLVPALDRACESADVVDNLTGLAVGLAGGTVVGRLAGALDRRPR